MCISVFQATAIGIVELLFFNGYGPHPGSRKTLGPLVLLLYRVHYANAYTTTSAKPNGRERLFNALDLAFSHIP